MKSYKYRLNELKLDVGEPLEHLTARAEKALGEKRGTLSMDDLTIMRESIDARHKDRIKMVYTVDVELNHRARRKELQEHHDKPEKPLVFGDERLTGRPVIVGFGPAGIFAALELAKNGYRPIVIERGSEMKKRVADVDRFRKSAVLDEESNVLFGEGGAGTFSDGKLTSGIKNGNIRKVLRTFADAGAGDEIMYLHRPHIGTDVLRRVIVNIRKEIEALGGEVRFDTKLAGFTEDESGLVSITVESRGRTSSEIDEADAGADGAEAVGTRDSTAETIAANALILAPGHSARDLFKMLKDRGVKMEQKPLSIGVRMEHPQTLIDRAQYGDEKRLPPADYKLSYKASNGRGVYSFCMCPGGEVIVCASEPGMLCVNGMSNRKRDSGTANSGILCDVRTSDFGSDDVLAGVEFQRKFERLAYINGGGNYTAPSCSMKEFLNREGRGRAVCDSLPEFASDAIREAVPYFAKKIKGYDDDDARVTAVETRSSSPVRILRGEDGQASVSGMFPAGEGAGYAGGITSAACDGIRAAQNLMKRFERPEA